MGIFYAQDTAMTNNYFINKNLRKLRQINDQLSNYPRTNSTDHMPVEQLILLEEREKLENRIERDSRAAGIKNQLQDKNVNQSLRDKYINDNNHNMYNSENNLLNRTQNPSAKQSIFQMYKEDTHSKDDNLVSPDERAAACEALKPNGCGPAGWKTVIADNPDGFDFSKACNNHDRNYSILEFGFERANDIFYREMLATPPMKKYRYTKTGKMQEYWAKPDAWAGTYYNFVKTFGHKFYNQAQRNAYICKYGKEPTT